MGKEWYAAYVKLGGKHPYELFLANEKVFEAITLDVYVHGDCIIGTREYCMKKWTQFIGSKAEANRYFEAVDSVTAYT